MTHLASELTDLPLIATDFLEQLGNRKIVAFTGEMGAGKTTFIQQLLRSMGVENLEGSPTYSLVNVYDSPHYGKVYHLDLFRIQSEEEAFDLGIEEVLYQDHIAFIEWPDHIENLLPDDCVRVYVRVNEELIREITWEIEPEHFGS